MRRENKKIMTLFLINQSLIFGKNINPIEYYQTIFNDWIVEYSMNISEIDYDMRLQIFANTHDIISIHNKG